MQLTLNGILIFKFYWHVNSKRSNQRYDVDISDK